MPIFYAKRKDSRTAGSLRRSSDSFSQSYPQLVCTVDNRCIIIEKLNREGSIAEKTIQRNFERLPCLVCLAKVTGQHKCMAPEVPFNGSGTERSKLFVSSVSRPLNHVTNLVPKLFRRRDNNILPSDLGRKASIALIRLVNLA